MNSTPLKLIIVGPFPPSAAEITGGVQASVYGQATTLLKQSDISSLQVFSSPTSTRRHQPSENTVIDGVHVSYLSAHLGFLSSAVWHLPNISRHCEGALVHIHGTGVLEAMLLLLLRIKGTPCVWSVHGLTEKETREKLRKQRSLPALLRYGLYFTLEGMMAYLAPNIVVNTEYVRRTLGQKNIQVIPQGIFLDEFANLSTATKHEQRIVSVGVFDPRKGHKVTLQAFARLHKSLPGSTLVIMGGLTDKRYFNELQHSLKELGLEHCVTLLANPPRDRLLQELAEAQIFALHSQEESQGIALCEALACGLPVVATKAGGIPDVITDHEDGILVPYGDISGYCDAMLSLLQDAPRREEMGRKARHKASTYDWKQIANKLLLLYNNDRNPKTLLQK